MTGSAFAMLDVVFAPLFSFLKGEGPGGGRGRFQKTGGWRMTGSALLRWTSVQEPGGYVYIGGGLEGESSGSRWVGGWRITGSASEALGVGWGDGSLLDDIEEGGESEGGKGAGFPLMGGWRIHVGALMGSCWLQDGSKMAPRWVQDGLRSQHSPT